MKFPAKTFLFFLIAALPIGWWFKDPLWTYLNSFKVDEPPKVVRKISPVKPKKVREKQADLVETASIDDFTFFETLSDPKNEAYVGLDGKIHSKIGPDNGAASESIQPTGDFPKPALDFGGEILPAAPVAPKGEPQEIQARKPPEPPAKKPAPAPLVMAKVPPTSSPKPVASKPAEAAMPMVPPPPAKLPPLNKIESIPNPFSEANSKLSQNPYPQPASRNRAPLAPHLRAGISAPSEALPQYENRMELSHLSEDYKFDRRSIVDSLNELQTMSLSWKQTERAPTAVMASTPVRATSMGNRETWFAVQVGAFRKKTSAEALKMNLQKKGYPAFLTIHEAPGKGVWTRVYIGRYRDRARAMEAASQAKARDGLNAVVVQPTG